MGRLIGSVFGLRRGERAPALLMALYHVLLLVSLYLLKPVRDSLFLSSRGPSELPFVFLLTTAVVIPVAFFHTRAGRRMAVGPLVDGASFLLVLSLVGLRGLLGVGGEWVTYLLYAWVSLYGLVVTSQFWLVANALFTPSQAKRVFPMLSAGAIVGAILGGEVTGLLVEGLGVASLNLLWAAGGVLVGSTVLGHVIRTAYHHRGDMASGEASERETQATGAMPVIRSSRHVQLIVGILALMVVVTTLVDYQFKTVAAQSFSSTEELTAFMGQFYGRVSIVALVVQVVVAPRLMRMVGIGGALAVLPGMLAAGAVGMLVMPGLVAGVFMRGSGQSLKHSVDKTGRELLFVPLSLETKKRVKVFIDLFVDQGAEGLGGLLLIVLIYGADLGIQTMSAVTLVLIVGWGALAYRARQTYVDQFRDKLRHRGTSADERASGEGTAGMEAVLDALCSHAESEALEALETLRTDETLPVPVDAVLCLFDHPAPTVRKEALRVLRVREVPDVGEEAAEMLRDSDPDVQVEAGRYLYCQLTDNHLERLRQGLGHDDPQIQAAAVGVIAEEGTATEYRLVSEELLRRLVALEGPRGAETRTQVARILGVLDRPYRNDLLHRLLRDEASQVVRAALKAAGNTGDRAFVDPLVRRLGDEPYRDAAQEALAAFGAPILGTLYDYLVDADLSVDVRTAIPPVFVHHSRSFGAALLVRSLDRVCVPVRHAVVRALSKVGTTGDVSLDRSSIEEAIEWEIGHYAALGQVLRFVRHTAPPTGATISGERLDFIRDETLERLFRLLGLRYDHEDLSDAYRGMTSPDPVLQDSAVEFVDNVVDYSTRRLLLPLLDDEEGEQAMRVGRTHFDVQLQTWADVRDYLSSVDDPRLAVMGTEAETNGTVRASGQQSPASMGVVDGET